MTVYQKIIEQKREYIISNFINDLLSTSKSPLREMVVDHFVEALESFQDKPSDRVLRDKGWHTVVTKYGEVRWCHGKLKGSYSKEEAFSLEV